MGRRTTEVARSSDELRKTQIRTVTQRARKALEAGIFGALRTHGIFENGKCVPSGDLPDHWMAASDRPALDAAIARWERQSQTPTEAVARFAREACYTWLNRLAAVRMLESRRLIAKPIARLDPKSNLPAVVQQVAELSPVLLRASEIAEAALWQAVFAELSSSIGALFDPNDPHGRIFPGSAAIANALSALGELDDSVWREDDTLGWLYQFFTTKDERAVLRKKKGASFTVDDLAVINQFYTPNWVVRFLVDNTLGGLWRRMHPESKITEFCTLLLPPNEAEPPYESKRVRELRILDPACGAMHFGVYAFDVLRWMYQEEGLERDADIPRLIVEKNLAGIDIDRRAIQISALNLYMKAAEALRAMGEDLPRNLCFWLGCADAPKPSEAAVKRLQAGIDDLELQQAFTATIASLDNLHAAGSLFDVEADVCVELSNRCAKTKVKVADEGLALPGLLMQLGGSEASGGTRIESLATWARMLAERAFRVDDVTEGLAAEDALLGARVLQLICQRYDVVLMNPPYGATMPSATKAYLKRRYPKSKSDLYGAFFELAFRVVREGGMVGALTSKTYLYLDSFRHVRSHLLDSGMLTTLIDAGHDLLFESTVDTAAMIAIASHPAKNARATILRIIREADREEVISRIVHSLRSNSNFKHDILYHPSLADLRKLPTQTLAYWVPPAVVLAYTTYPFLEPTYGKVRVGLQTGKDERFLRYWWEVPEECIGQGKRWVAFAKGGDYSPYYESLLHVVDWKNDGQKIKSSSSSRPQNQEFYFRKGLTFPRTADRFHTRYFPAGAIFADSGPCIFGNYTDALAGFLNTKIAQVLLMAQSSNRHFEVGQMQRLCVPPLNSELGRKLSDIAKEAYVRAEEWASENELDKRFKFSGIQYTEKNKSKFSLGVYLVDKAKQHSEFILKRQALTDFATEAVGTSMHFTAADFEEITRTFGSDIGVDDNARIRGQRSRKSIDPLSEPSEHARRFVSGYLRNLMATRHIATLEQVVVAIEADITKRFGVGAMDELESYLKKPLPHWLRDDYAKYHFTLYSSRPRILRLTAKHANFIGFVDALRVRADDLRRFRLDVIEPSERAAKAVLAGGNTTLTKRRAVEDQLEDFQTFTNFIASVLTDWKDDVDDVRPRVEIFRKLATYLPRKK
jgi:hypothetical protein